MRYLPTPRKYLPSRMRPAGRMRGYQNVRPGRGSAELPAGGDNESDEGEYTPSLDFSDARNSQYSGQVV